MQAPNRDLRSSTMTIPVVSAATLSMASMGYRSIIRRLAKNSLWLLSGAAVSQGLLLLVMVYIGRHLGPANLGRFGMIQTTVNLLGSLAGVSLGLTSAKYAAQYRSTDCERAGRAIGLAAIVALGAATVLSAALVLSAPFLARTTLHSPEMVGLLRMGAAWVFCIILNAEQVGVLSGLEDFKTLAKLNAIRGSLMLVGGGFGVIAGGIVGAILGFSVASCVLCAITAAYVHSACRRSGIRAVYLSRDHEFALITGFSLPSVLASIVALPVTWLASAVLVNQLNGYSYMGLFNAATHWRGVVCFLPAGLAQVGLPVLANILGGRDQGAYRKAFLTIIAGLTLSAGCVAIILCATVDTLVRLYGAGYVGAKPVFLIVIVTAVVSSIDSALALALSSLGKMWSLTCLTLTWAVLTIGFALWWIPVHKTLGLAAAFLAAYVLEVPVRGWYVYRSLCNHYAKNDSNLGLRLGRRIVHLQEPLVAERDPL